MDSIDTSINARDSKVALFSTPFNGFTVDKINSTRSIFRVCYFGLSNSPPVTPGSRSFKNAMKMPFQHIRYKHFMLQSVILAIAIGILEICSAMAEFAFLHFSIEALMINKCKVFDCLELGTKVV